MTSKNFLDLTINIIGVGKKSMLIEKGCSFENNGNIYRVNNDCKLAIWDKAKEKWAAGNEITMTSYQFDTFEAVANNDKKAGLSKKDIDKAIEMQKDGKLQEDLQETLKNGYKAENPQRYTNNHAISAYVTNGNKSRSANLIFKYGSAEDAVKISELVKKQTGEVNKTEESKNAKRNNGASKPKNVVKTQQTKQSNKNSKNKKPKNVKITTIQKEWLPYIKNISQKTGISELCIKQIIQGEAYTPYAEYKNENGGLIEGGFGHTTQADHNTDFKVGNYIDIDTAFKWLEQDLIDKKNAIKKFGDKYYNYSHIPAGLQDAMLDVAFNRGQSKLDPDSKSFDPNYNSVIANIKNKNYAAAAVRLRQAEDKMSAKYRNGLRKRNAYRLLMGIRGLAPQNKIRAMYLFNKDGYYNRTVKNISNEDATELKKAWENAYNVAQKQVNEIEEKRRKKHK